VTNSSVNDNDVYDLIIIGGGPVGQFSAYYAGLRTMKTKIIDSLPELGGQLSALYPEKYIFDVAGFPKVYARDLVASLTEQLSQYEITLALSQKVTHLEPGDIITLKTDTGETHYAKSVIVAAGVGAFLPRKMDVPGLAELESRGVHYFVSNKGILADKKLVIVGGGDSAFDWSLNLAPAAESVLQIHRSDRFKAHEDTIKQVEESSVVLKTFHELKEVHGEEHVEGVTIFDNRSKEEFFHPCDELLLNLGFLTNLGPIKEWGLEIVGNSVHVNSRMETNIKGVYGAGDIVDYSGKLKLIATGFGEAAIAVNHAKAFVDPTAKVGPGHSSESVPKKAA
jgi:thioredoxin reductase (NADPH)